MEWDPQLRGGGRPVRASTSLLEQDDIDVVVNTLQEQLALEGDHLLLLGRLQGAHQGLEDVGTAVVIEQDTEFHAGLTVSI